MNHLEEIRARLGATEGKHWGTAEAEAANLDLLAHAAEDIRYLLELLDYNRTAVRALLDEMTR